MRRNYLFITLFAVLIGAASLFNSCSKEESNEMFDKPEPMNDEILGDPVQLTEYSNMIGCEFLPEEDYQKIDLAKKVPAAKASYKYLTTPNVGNQGPDGACVGWGVGYSARSIMTGARTYFSPAYIYNQIKLGDCSAGSYISTALNLVRNEGVCTWSYMPYQAGDCYTQPNYNQRRNASYYKVSGYSRVSINVSSIRNQIAYGRPVVVGGPVDSYFMNLGYNRILTYASGSGGGHCYTVVGYNDDYRCFLIQNSWGTSWATNGYGWISYDIIGTLFREAYIMY